VIAQGCIFKLGYVVKKQSSEKLCLDCKLPSLATPCFIQTFAD